MTDFPATPATGDAALDAELNAARQAFATSSDGTKLHTVTIGNGPLVVLIHGFPDFWFTWRHHMIALARAGFTACAFDLRGYNLSGAPADDQAYREAALVEDVRAVIAASGHDSAIVVGHDWGGFVAWSTAIAFPSLVTRLAALNIPHPDLLMRSYARDPAQQAAGAYARTFQALPPETRLPPEALLKWVTDSAIRPAYLEAIGRSHQPGMLAYYRVNYPSAPYVDIDDASLRPVTVPTLLIYGLKDTFLLPSAIDGTWRLVAAPLQLLTLPTAGHFVQHDATEVVSQALVSWCAGR